MTPEGRRKFVSRTPKLTIPAGAGRRSAGARCRNPDPLVPVPVDIRSVALTVLAVIAADSRAAVCAGGVHPARARGADQLRARADGRMRIERRRIPRALGAGVRAARARRRRRLDALPAALAGAADRRAAAGRRRGGCARMVERRAPRTGDAHPEGAAGGDRTAEGRRIAGTPPPARPGVTRVQVEEAPFNVSDYVMWGSLGVAAAARTARADSVPRRTSCSPPATCIAASW